MNKRWFVLMMLVVCFFAFSSSDFRAQKGNVLSPAVKDGRNQANVKIEKDYGKMPLYFIPNQGQMDKQVQYYVQGKDKTVYFTSEGVTYSLNAQGSSQLTRGWVVKLEFVGAKKNVKPESLEQSGTVVSYFQGKPEQWHAGLQAASKIIYRELWRGIDLVYYGTVNKMKYEFIVHPGADPSRIKLTYRGAESVKENTQGQLEVQTPAGGFFDDKPEAWQEIAGKRESVSLKYALKKEQKAANKPNVTYGFYVGKYDRNQTLILDPAVIVYCGYIGGSADDIGAGIAVDASGCAYVTGQTNSNAATFPVAIGPDLTSNGSDDVFVAKVKADGTGLDYCGYIGGIWDEDGQGIAVDASGNAYVVGRTNSDQNTFPVTGGPDLSFNGDTDAFVAKVNAAGTNLIYCGYIGGSEYDYGSGIAVDSAGFAYLVGPTHSSQDSFPVVGGPHLIHNGDCDVFVAKVKSDGTGLVYCGYIGGSGFDGPNRMALDALGCIYVIGTTNSEQTPFLTFPVTVGPDLTYNGGEYDAFVAKVKSDGSSLDYCGYIGGTGIERGIGIAVDGSGYAYVTGHTSSNEITFPVIGGPDLTHNGGNDAFVAKVNADGASLVYCGYIGGTDEDWGMGIATDASGCAYVNGFTGSDETTFPVAGWQNMIHGGEYDAFVAKVKSNGAGLDFCGYIGGIGWDEGYGITVDTSGCVYVTGWTESTEPTFPVTVGPNLIYNGGISDAFVAKISWTNPSYTVNFAAGSGGTLTGTKSQTVLQGNNCSAVEAVPNDGYNFVNWTGTGGFETTTDNPLTVTNVNSDMTITANFIDTVNGWVPLEGLQNNMIVYGKAYNGNNPASEGDWIGAFGPGGIPDCRGNAAVQTNGNYYLTIGSNEISGETITFKLWPLPSGPSIDGSESISFINNGVYDGLPLHFGSRGQAFNLVNGWNWISFNTLPDDTSFNSVFGTPTVIEQIKSQSQAAIYTGGSWIGDLTDMSGIANGIMYKVKTNQAYAFNVTGMTVPYNTPLSLITGWNWTAYLPTLSQPVADAVNSIITPVSQVKSQTQSVIKIGSVLFGDLTQMEPNKGYTILMSQPGVLQYPQGVSVFPDQARDKATAVTTQAVSWPMIKGNQYNMIAYGKVYFEGKPIDKTGYYLGSYGSKGVSDGRSLSPVKTDGSYFATILGNANGEKIKFKLINSANGRAYDVTGSFNFQADSLKPGFDLKTLSIKLTSPNGGETWNPRKSYDITWRSGGIDNIRIELYKGTALKTVICASTPAGIGKYPWTIPANIPQGTKYKIKISSVDIGLNLSDAGNDYFTIAGSSGTDGSL